MRSIAISLVVVGSLGLMALGGRAIAADRTPQARRVNRSDSAVAAAPAAALDRVWYGGTLAPIVVEAAAPDSGTAGRKQACPRSVTN
jgi:hypothetical protein